MDWIYTEYTLTYIKLLLMNEAIVHQYMWCPLLSFSYWMTVLQGL